MLDNPSFCAIDQEIHRIEQQFIPALKASLTHGDDLDKVEFAEVLSALGVLPGTGGGSTFKASVWIEFEYDDVF